MTQTVEKDPGADFVPGQLVELTLKTFLDGTYVFPDFDAGEAKRLILGARATGALAGEQLTLINASGACLVLPTRIVKSLSTDAGQLSWARER